MKYAKVLYNGENSCGIIEGDKIKFMNGNPYSGVELTGESALLSEVKLLAPCDPTKIVCIGKNYFDHAVEFGEPIPDTPTIFIKPTTSLNDPDGLIEYPSASKRV
ncbi:MAG: DUF2437 domain-containing protein, partial [Clostridia bacterium]|nr:DUF2437 domain-containing protein [Clostridia bacterium]